MGRSLCLELQLWQCRGKLPRDLPVRLCGECRSLVGAAQAPTWSIRYSPMKSKKRYINSKQVGIMSRIRWYLREPI